MRILFINENYGLHGGVEQNILDAAKGLRARARACYLAYGSATKRGTKAFDAAFHETCAITELGASHVTLRGSFDDAQRKRLAQVAGRCPVHKTLANGVHISDAVSFDSP